MTRTVYLRLMDNGARESMPFSMHGLWEDDELIAVFSRLPD
jgi:hypothetical protein